MMDTHPDLSSALNVTSDEAHIWLLQEQHPERVLRQLHAWRLDDSADLSRITLAIQTLIEHQPDLNARYHFTEEGDLRKTHTESWQPCLTFSRSATCRDAIEHLLERQAGLWRAAEHPPFQALIIHTDEDIILGFLTHRILDQRCPASELHARFIAAYAGQPFKGGGAAQRLDELSHARGRSPVPAILKRSQVAWDIRDAWGDAPRSTQPQLALRWQTVLTAKDTGNPTANVPAIALRFARFVAHLGDQPTLGLSLHQAAGCAHVLVQREAEDACVLQSLEDRWRALERNSLVESLDANSMASLPWVQVHWEPAVEPTSLLANPLLLPSAEALPDLQLSLQSQAGDGLRVTLTTGPAVSNHVGESLLGSFLDALDTADLSSVTRAPAHLERPAAALEHPSQASPSRPDQATVTAAILQAFRTALSEPGMQQGDDFFDFGGHSLLATRIIGKLASSHGIKLGFSDFFSAPTAVALASRARISDAPQSGSQPLEQRTRAPFALAQASLGRAYQAFDFGTIFNLPFAVSFLDPVDEALFEQAFADLIERHASLRTTFHFEDGQAWQQTVPPGQVSRFKWFWNSQESHNASLASEASWTFDLSRQLPMRVRFMTHPQNGRQTLSLLVHHMAIDEWSLNVMMDELAIAYRARANDTAPQWASPAPSFHDFAARQAAEGVNRQHLDYWTSQLRDATRGLHLPSTDGRAAVPASQASTRAQWLEIKPEQRITDGLYAFARQNDSSLFSVVYTAIALSLHKLGDLNELIIGTSASGRTDPAFFETVGYFTTMVAHRIRFQPEQSVGDLLLQVTRTVNDSMEYADVPLETIQQALGMTPADGLLFDVYIQIHADNALNGALDAADGAPIRYRQIDPEKNESMFGVQFEIMENVIEGQRLLRLVITYRTDRFSESQIDRLSATIHRAFAVLACAEGVWTELRAI